MAYATFVILSLLMQFITLPLGIADVLGPKRYRGDIYDQVINVLPVLLVMTYAKSPEFPVDTVVAIAVEVLNWSHSTCIFLLHSIHQQGLQENQKLANISTLFSKKHVMTIPLPLEQFLISAGEFNCHSLSVIYSSDQLKRDFLLQVSKADKLTSVKWLLFLDENTSLDNFLADIQIPLDCEFLVAQRSKTIVSLTEVYRVHHSQPLQKFCVANWTSKEHFSWTSLSSFSRKGDLQGAVIKGAAIPYNPYLTVSKYEDKKPIKFSGYLMELWNELEHRMNFTTEYVTPKDGVFGFLNNGSWNGVVGMVVRKQVDVGISFFAYLRDRIEAVDFLPPIWNVKLMVHIKQPEMEVSTVSHILSPFVPLLWGVVMLSMAVLSLLLSVTWYLHPKSKITDDFTPYSLYESWLYVYGSFCQQGHDTTPKTMACRLVYFSTYFIALILFMAYSATFISFLTVRRHDLPFTNFQGLLDDGTYRLGVLSGSARIDFFKKSKVHALNKVYWKLIDPDIDNLPQSDIEGLQRICRNNKYSYIISHTTLRGLARHIPCCIIGVPQAYYSITASLIINKFSPYKKLFNHHLQEIKRTGVLTRIEDNAWPPKYIEIIEDPPSSVSLETVTIFFVVLAAGTVASIFILLVEFAHKKFQQSKLSFNRLPL